MIFNVNDKVKIKLTEKGKDQVWKDYLELCKRMGYTPKRGYEGYPPEDQDGWSEWQMWDLIKTFGPYTGIGLEPLFETDIEIPIKETDGRNPTHLR